MDRAMIGGVVVVVVEMSKRAIELREEEEIEGGVGASKWKSARGGEQVLMRRGAWKVSSEGLACLSEAAD